MKRKNLGNYEHEEVTLKAQVEEGDDAMDVTARVKFACDQALGMVVKAAQETPKEEAPKKAVKKTTKKVTKKATAKKEAVEEVEAQPISEVPELLKKVVDALRSVIKAKGKDVALEILADFEVTKSDQLCATQAADVIAKAEKAVA